jgi:hypothetical protein
MHDLIPVVVSLLVIAFNVGLGLYEAVDWNRVRSVGTDFFGVSEWEEFAERNADLLVWKGGVLEQYYRDATLWSDLARAVFVFPDKCP